MITIYGFGNALIDIHIPVQDFDIASIGIPKNTMQHINKQEMKNLLTRFNKNIIKQSVGGSIANSLHAANKFNCYTNYSCSIKKDYNGNKFLDGFSLKNHKSHIIESVKSTGVCLIFITPDGERTMAAYLGANKDLAPESLNVQRLIDSDWLLFDSFSISTNGGYLTAKESVAIAKENNVSICYGLADLSLLQPSKNKISWLLDQGIEYIVGNSEEFIEFDKLFDISPKKKLISKGNKGATLGKICIDAPNISCISTNGAGDGLMGVFIASLRSKGERRALQEAINYASKICLTEEPRI